MPIPAVCDECFAEYKVKDEFAGRRMKCKQCGSLIAIPKPARRQAAEVDEWEVVDSDEEPADLPPVPSRKKSTPAPKAKKRSARSSRESDFSGVVLDPENRWWVVLVSLGAAVLLLGIVAPTAAFVLGLMAGLVAALVGGIVMLVTIASESIVCLLLCWLVPFYSLYYLTTRWEVMKKPFLIQMGGIALLALGGFFGLSADRGGRAVAGGGGRQGAAAARNEAPEGDKNSLFPLASVGLPAFPELGNRQEVGESGCGMYTVYLTPGPANAAGSPMAMRVYVPAGEPAEHSLGCVLVPPAGTNLIAGNSIDGSDYHAESLPYAEAGYCAVTFSLDGDVGDRERATTEQHRNAYFKFRDAHAGVVNARNALEFVLAKVPQVSPQRLYIAGHSSAGTLSLLFAVHEPRVRACIAFAAETDVAAFHSDAGWLTNLAFPGMTDFLVRSSPKTHLSRFNCPVFLFHAADDSVVPISRSTEFDQALRQLGKTVHLSQVPVGEHYDSMIQQGIPQAIQWLKSLPSETAAAPAAEAELESDDETDDE